MSNRSSIIRDALATVLAPLVAADGGRVYVVKLDDEELCLHWAGRYAGSPAAGLLHEEVVVPLLEHIAPGLSVRWSSGCIIPAGADLIEPPSRDVGTASQLNVTGPNLPP